MRNNKKGITLVALVVTIIVLLILAGVTIATITGNDSIIGRSSEAKASMQKAKVEEEDGLDDAVSKIDEKTNPNIKSINTEEELKEGLESGKQLVIKNNIMITGNIFQLNGGIIDGKDYTFDFTNASIDNSDTGLITTGGTIKNLTIIQCARGIGSGSSGNYELKEDLIIDNVTVDESLYALNVGVGNGYKMKISNSKLYGWTSYDGLSSAEFTDCTFGLNNAEDPGYANYGGYLQLYNDTTFTNCKFETNFHISAGEVVGTVTLDNCTYNGEKVTAENFAELLTYDISYDSEVNNLKNSTVIVDGVTVGTDTYH